MKVIVVSPGRLHAFDLAFQLQKYGILKQLITGYPKFEVIKYGINKNLIKSIYINEIVNRLTYKLFNDYRFDYIACELFDLYNSYTIDTSADVYIIWSSYAEHTIKKIKKHNKNAKIILERGSAHIQLQEEILSKNSGVSVIHKKIIQKELVEYNLTDYISIPSLFVKQSFLDKGISEEKLFLNNYGVDLKQFPFQFKATNKNDFNVGYVGTLSAQKNVSGLIEAISILYNKGIDIKLLIVGPIDHNSFNENELKQDFITYAGYVNQSELHKYYKQMDVFVLNSIQDGFGMVISQALASGVPVIATRATGALDIIVNDYNGYVIEVNDPNEIVNKIEYLYYNPDRLNEIKHNAFKSIQMNLTWDKYGQRYLNFLNKL